MIASNISIIDLDPFMWKHLGELVDWFFPERKVIYVLHDKGRVINIFHPVKGLLKGSGPETGKTADLAGSLLKEHEDSEEVWVMEKSGLINYYSLIQAPELMALDSDEYMSRMHTLFFNCTGIEIFKRSSKKERGEFFSRMRQLAKDNLPKNCTFVLEVLEGGKPHFNAVMVFRKHQLVVLTSFDHFEKRRSAKERDASPVALALEEFGGEVKHVVIEKAELKEYIEKEGL